MRLWVLGSGSRGNAVLLECGESRVLVDAGFGVRALATRLRQAGVDPASIEACILTHDHSDHVKGAAAAARRWNWRLFATPGTAACEALAGARAESRLTTFAAGDTLRFTRLEVATLPTPHDASEPVGLMATATTSGMRAGICYDVGFASEAVRALCREVDLLLLEANHDEQMLWSGPYPPWLCQRIAGNAGHLSNRAAGELARESATRQLAHVVLAHLSEKNNTPEVATSALRSALRGTRFRGTLSVAMQDAVCGPFAPRGERLAAAAQLSLF